MANNMREEIRKRMFSPPGGGSIPDSILTDTMQFPHQRAEVDDVRLSTDAQDRLLDELERIYGGETVASVVDMVDAWKGNNFGKFAQKFEVTFLQALNPSIQPLSNVSFTPSKEQVTLAATMIHTSRRFIELNYTPPLTAYRGLRQPEMTELRRDIFRSVADSYNIDTVSVGLAPLSRFSLKKGIADKWGDQTAVVKSMLPNESLVVAVDYVFPMVVPEFEVNYHVPELVLPPENVWLQSRRKLDEVLVGAREGDSSAYEVLLTEYFRMKSDVDRLGRGVSSGVERLARDALADVSGESAGGRITRDKAERALEDVTTS